MTPIRGWTIAVTGSRRAGPEHRERIIDALWAELRGAGPGTVIHGDAPGVDTIAAELLAGTGWTPHPVPADWTGPCRPDISRDRGGCPPEPHRRRSGGRDWCPHAGPRRNQAVADLMRPYSMAIAMPLAPPAMSRGTWDCIRRLRRAGVDVRVHRLHPGGAR